jgi:hypothetical protein
MKLISPLFALFLLLSCASGQLANQEKIQIQIKTSKDRLVNVVTNDESFRVLSDNIAAEIQKRLFKNDIVSSTDEIKTGEKIILLIEYEYLETDMVFNKIVYGIKGQLKLIEPKTQKVFLNESFHEVEDKISEIVNSLSNKISKKVIRYFK